MYNMIADGNFLTKLVCDNTDCLSFIITLLNIITVIYLAYCASFRVNRGVRIFGWVWAAVVIAGTITVVAIHACMFTIVSALFTALVLMALFGVTFEAIGEERRKAKEDPQKEEKPAPYICPFATLQCSAVGQPVFANQNAPVEEKTPVTDAKEDEKEDEVASEVAATDAGLSLKESLALAKEVVSAPTVINKKYIFDFLKETFGKKVECNSRANYTKTGLPLPDTHFALNVEGRKCFAYIYETNSAVVLLLRLPDKYAQTIMDNGLRVNKSAFPKCKDTWYSIVVDGTYTETDIQEILIDAFNLSYER